MTTQPMLLEPVRMESEVYFACTICGRRVRVASCHLVFPPPVCDHRPIFERVEMALEAVG